MVGHRPIYLPISKKKSIRLKKRKTEMKKMILLLLVIAVSALGAQSRDNYQIWKAERAAQAAPGSRSMVSNDFVAVHCNDLTGMFTIGTVAGENLLFGFPSEGSTSHTNIKIDGTVYSNDWVSGTTMMPTASTTVENNTIATTWDIEGIEITQYLEPVQDNNAGAIWIHYEVHNNTSNAHDIGILLELDTMVNWNDAAPLATSYGFVTVETTFAQPAMPTFWQAFESETYDPEFLIGEGVVAGSNAVAPDLFIAGDWGNLVDVVWDYTVSGEDYWDSAVIYRWNQVSVAASGVRMLGTLYGTGEVSANQGDLTLLLAAPDELVDMGGYLVPNPFEVNLIVHNTTDGTANNVQATIDLPTGLSLTTGSATQTVDPTNVPAAMVGICSWTVMAENPVSNMTYTIAVDVTSSNMTGNSISRNIFVPHYLGSDDGTVPVALTKLNNSPNPFNPSTTISFTLPAPGRADVLVYDIRGRLVRTFTQVAAPQREASVTWNGTDDSGNSVGSGVFLYQLRQDGVILETHRMVLLK